MNILAFDTSTEILSVCVVCEGLDSGTDSGTDSGSDKDADRARLDGGIDNSGGRYGYTDIWDLPRSTVSRVEKRMIRGIHRDVHLMAEIDALLHDIHIPIDDIDLFVCSRGPGSYTGLRIGLATAKGLAAGGNRAPIVTVSTLDAIAYRHRHTDRYVVPIVDARRDRWFCSIYIHGAPLTVTMDLSALDMCTYVREQIAQRSHSGGDKKPPYLVQFVGPHAAHCFAWLKRRGYQEQMERLGEVVAEDDGYAEQLARIGYERYRSAMMKGCALEEPQLDYVSLSQPEESRLADSSSRLADDSPSP